MITSGHEIVKLPRWQSPFDDGYCLTDRHLHNGETGKVHP